MEYCQSLLGDGDNNSLNLCITAISVKLHMEINGWIMNAGCLLLMFYTAAELIAMIDRDGC